MNLCGMIENSSRKRKPEHQTNKLCIPSLEATGVIWEYLFKRDYQQSLNYILRRRLWENRQNERRPGLT